MFVRSAIVFASLAAAASGCMTIAEPTLSDDAGANDARSPSVTDAAPRDGAADAGDGGSDASSAMLAVTPAMSDYGTMSVGGESAPISFVVRNGGGGASGTLSTVLAGGDFAITADTCAGAVLASEASCTVAVRFAPAFTGERVASLGIEGTPGGAASAALRGTGLAPGALTVKPTSHDFGSLDVAAAPITRSVTATNDGESATGVISVVITGANASAFALTSDGCTGKSLAPAQSCTTVVAFDPAAVGGHIGALELSAEPGGIAVASLGGTGTAKVMVSRAGTGAGVVTSTPVGIDCGSACSASFSGGSVALNATVAAGSFLAGWSGCDSSTGLACTLAVTQERPVTATFMKASGAIAAGSSHTCALAGGGVTCWGQNGNGQLGDGTTTLRKTPVPVSGLTSGVVAIAAGATHTCALTGGGGVKCWGGNGTGQIGDGTTSDRIAPVDVVGLGSGVVAIAAGTNHTCAVSSAGAVRCWGANHFGQLGDGTSLDRHEPTEVAELSEVAAIALGERHSCAVTGAGSAYCWGDNGGGQLGNGTSSPAWTPSWVFPFMNASSISAGGWHSCAIATNGYGSCWGANGHGQVGDGSTADRKSPVDVATDSELVGSTAGAGHTCAVTTAGGAVCWGDNYYGQLGDETTASQSIPVAVSGLSAGVAAMAAGLFHTCALTTAGAVKCWGRNSSGQLGDGTTTDRLEPVDVSGL